MSVILYASAKAGLMQLQLARLHARARERGLAVLTEVADRAHGPRAGRPRLRAAVARLEPGQVLVACSIGAVASSAIALENLMADVEGRNAELVLLDGADMPTVRVLADLERARVRGLAREGMRRARRAGAHVGRPRRVTDDQVEQAVRLRLNGLSWAQTAAAVGASARSLRRLVAVAATTADRQDSP